MTRLTATRFTELVGCELPLMQAGMGGVTTVELAGAVASTGALGMLAGTGMPPDALRAAVEQVPAGSVGVNLLVPFLDPAALDAAAASARLVECFWAEPDAALVSRIHAGGALAAWQVGSVAEARAAADAGCDLVVAQGVEAGGHVRGGVPILPLLDAVLAAVEVPVVAAGGIGSGRALAAVLAAGADAGKVGTCFLATPEADVHPAYADALVAAGPTDTVLTEAFSLGWPDAPHRVLRSCVDASDADPATRSPMPPGRSFGGPVAGAALYAGQSVGSVRRIRPAAAIVDELVTDAAEALREIARRV